MLHGHAQIYLGARAGASTSKQVMVLAPGYTGNNFEDDYKFALVGFSAAITSEFPVAGALKLMVEADYSERGYRVDSELPFTPDASFKSSYAGLSILPMVRIGQGKCKLELFAGADISKRLGVRDNSNGYTVVWEADHIFNGPRQSRASLLANSSLAAIGGAGLAFHVGPSLIHLNARYLFGLSNVYASKVAFTDIQGSGFGTGKVYDRAFILSLGYSLPLSRSAWSTALKN